MMEKHFSELDPFVVGQRVKRTSTRPGFKSGPDHWQEGFEFEVKATRYGGDCMDDGGRWHNVGKLEVAK